MSRIQKEHSMDYIAYGAFYMEMPLTKWMFVVATTTEGECFSNHTKQCHTLNSCTGMFIDLCGWCVHAAIQQYCVLHFRLFCFPSQPFELHLYSANLDFAPQAHGSTLNPCLWTEVSVQLLQQCNHRKDNRFVSHVFKQIIEIPELLNPQASQTWACVWNDLSKRHVAIVVSVFITQGLDLYQIKFIYIAVRTSASYITTIPLNWQLCPLIVFHSIGHHTCVSRSFSRIAKRMLHSTAVEHLEWEIFLTHRSFLRRIEVIARMHMVGYSAL